MLAKQPQRVRAECPRRRAIAHRPLSRRLGEIVDGLLEQPLFLGLFQRRKRFMNPSVYADLVTATLENGWDHLGMNYRADGRNEERRGNLIAVQQFENPRQAGLRAEIGGRQSRG